ncbi:MAG: AtpZ/AtpI family protein [Alphaproteobacteria bacterium]|nr:AtpZ/AtpI family protein [Alphaproteobacteria bacterium]MBQ9235687.1 AtpZ/AtpI family protein [Alphaproteobacteria bacterium]
MDKIPEDLRRLEEKIEKVRAREARLQGKDGEREFSRASRIGLRVCTDLLAAVVVGAALGYVLDEVLPTKPWGLITFLLFGGAAGVLNVYRLSKQEENNL